MSTATTTCPSLHDDGWQPGLSLSQRDYSDLNQFDRDVRWLGESQWLLVDHESRIPNAGDYFLFEMGRESVIVVRTRTGGIAAHMNVCRHRGSRICLEKSGSIRTLSCPYHAWTYDLSGKLIHIPLVGGKVDSENLSLHPCHVAIQDGLIFLNVSEGQPPAFSRFIERFRPLLAPHQLGNAKVAARRTFTTNANWKLVVENFYECYHCKPAHPTYCSVHDELKMLAMGAGPGSGDKYSAKFAPIYEAWCDEERRKGRVTDSFADGPEEPFFQSAARIPIRKGALTESLDGKPVAPLMVAYSEYDGAQTGCVFNPVGVVLANADHAILFRMTPRGALVTDTEAIWLVRADAQEGKDYDVQRLMDVWAPTLGEDKTITENNQKGILSSRYRPGPYQPQEQRISDFGRWYRSQIAQL